MRTPTNHVRAVKFTGAYQANDRRGHVMGLHPVIEGKRDKRKGGKLSPKHPPELKQAARALGIPCRDLLAAIQSGEKPLALMTHEEKLAVLKNKFSR